MDWSELTTTVLVGAGSGILGTFFAPWVTWGIEKRKFRLTARSELVASIRKMAADEVDRNIFKVSAEYFQIRVHLRDSTRKAVEKPQNHITIVSGEAFNPTWKQVLVDLADIEARWKLL